MKFWELILNKAKNCAINIIMIMLHNLNKTCMLNILKSVKKSERKTEIRLLFSNN